MSLTDTWRSAMPPLQLSGGLALAWNGLGFVQRKADRQLLFPRHELKQLFADQYQAEHGIGFWQTKAVYLLELADQTIDEQQFELVSARDFMLQADFSTSRMLGFASQIGNWSRQHRFCGSCGKTMFSDPLHRRRYCLSCGLENYPRIAPCMIVLVSRADEILLARAPRFVPGMYSVLAGFAEPGESIEGCVAREVMEETSIRVNNLQYITSQNWPFPHSLMLGFHASYLSGEIQRQEDELEDAAWFNVHQLPDLPMPGSIARYLIDLHLQKHLDGITPVLPC